MRRRKKSDLCFAALVTAVVVLCVYALFHGDSDPKPQPQIVYSAGENTKTQQRPAFLKTEFSKTQTAEREKEEPRIPPILTVAREQLGNEGGERYWRWFGFESRVDWCACFVSWCAEECGYIEKEILPRFSCCESEWFKERGVWRDSDYIPSPGDLIFFDWTQDGTLDHVGLVETIENGYVCTIEGNTGDLCARQRYALEDPQICGYAKISDPDCS